MQPIHVGGHTWHVRHLHPLRLAGLLEAYDDATTRPALRLAHLGMVLVPETGAKHPERRPSESPDVYGQRVYDYLTGLGAGHWDVMRYAAEALSEACEGIPAMPSEEDVAEMGKASMSGALKPASDSPTATVATPSCG